ncbi:MAG: DUF4825 domain-containing protein [Tissierellia bacterium]|nr:DUF4825 domain-containing protein [Tissierellia bacterium]
MNVKFRILLPISMVFLVACSLISGNKELEEQSKRITDLIYPHRTEYVGDNSKVGALLYAMKIDYEKFAILSDKEPYGLKVLVADSDREFETTDFRYQSYELLGLIKNLDYVIFTNGHLDLEQKMDVEQATEELGYSPKLFYEDKALFQKYYRETLD